MTPRHWRYVRTSRMVPPWRLTLGSLLSLVLLHTGVATAQIPPIPIPRQPFAQPVPVLIGGPATANPVQAVETVQKALYV